MLVGNFEFFDSRFQSICKERNMDMYIPSVKVSLITRTGFISMIIINAVILLFQFFQIILWPTVFKDSRYKCENSLTDGVQPKVCSGNA